MSDTDRSTVATNTTTAPQLRCVILECRRLLL